MDIITILLIAVGLAMDAFAVSVASGMGIANIKTGHIVRIALFFGGFQALMPVVGWLAGLTLRGYIAPMDHWVAFLTLAFLGGKMIYEARFMSEGDRCKPSVDYAVLLGLAIATSIDALAVGVTFAVLDVSVIEPVIIIGLVTFAMSYAGVMIGRKFCNFPGAKVEILGGLILIGIGLKILIEHMLKGI